MAAFLGCPAPLLVPLIDISGEHFPWPILTHVAQGSLAIERGSTAVDLTGINAQLFCCFGRANAFWELESFLLKLDIMIFVLCGVGFLLMDPLWGCFNLFRCPLLVVGIRHFRF